MPPRIEALARAALFASLATAAPLAAACGICLEDRVAAVYDHDVVEAAVAKQRHVVFLSIEGGAHGEAARKAVAAALESGGALKGTTRIAVEQAACSAAFDPDRTSMKALVTRANKPLAARGLALAPLRVIDDGGKLKEP